MSQDIWRLRDFSKVNAALNTHSPDIVHIQYPTSGFGHRLGPQLLAVMRSCVATLHEVSQAHLLRKLALYPFGLRPQRLIFTSEYEKRFATKWAPWIEQVSSVIPVGSNIATGPNNGQRTLDEVVYFGLIMPNKGLEQVLQLARLIQTGSIALRVRIVGKPFCGYESYCARLRRESTGLPIVWDTDLDHEHVSARLTNCAVGYLPFPDGASERRASLKALLANGVVVVSTRSVQTPLELESIVHFSDGAADALKRILSLLQNPKERERLQVLANRYMQQFEWRHIARLHENIYNSALQTTADCRRQRLRRTVLPQ